MPHITSIGSPFSVLKVRPLDNSKLKPEEIIKIPKGKLLGVNFPYSDDDKPVQAVRMVANATDLGLKAGEIFYLFHKEWIVNGKEWKLSTPGKKKNVGGLINLILNKRRKQYKPPMSPGDFHLVVVDDEALPTSTMECYDSNGVYLWSRKCLARGQTADWGVYAGDTPTGLYTLGQVWIADPGDAQTCKPYGVYCYDLVTVEDGEDKVNRGGICLHGGGSALGYSGCNADYQELVPTFGCIRMHNAELKNTIYPMWQKCDRSNNKIWVSVYQL